MKQKITKTKIAISLLGIICLIIYSFWILHRGVSSLEKKILHIEQISDYAKHISSYYYGTAILFLLWGIFLGFAMSAFLKIKNQGESNKNR